MITLRCLGAINLADESGQELDGLLRQPKRLALLAYLAHPVPGTWHRRDTLLALFWPELDATRARTALRNALYVIRQHLPDGVLRTRGDEEVSVDAGALQSDVAAVELALAAGRVEEALELHGGEYLPGLFVPDAQGFEEWLERERARVRGLAAHAAGRLSNLHEAEARWLEAATAQRRLVDLDPQNEAAVRRLIGLLDRAGDRQQALAAYDQLHRSMAEEFGAEPSADTRRLVDGIRAQRHGGQAAASPLAPPIDAPTGPVDDHQNAAPEPAVASSAARRSTWVGAVLLLALGGVGYVLWPRAAAGPPPSVPRLLILPMTNATGSPDMDYVTVELGEDIARRLQGMRTVHVRSGARADWAPASANSVREILRATSAQLAYQSRLTMAGDSLEVEGTLLDAGSGLTRPVVIHRFHLGDLRDAGSLIAARIAGAGFRSDIPQMPRQREYRTDPEAYRLTLEGWHRLLNRTQTMEAGELFQRAIDIDPGFARAWSGLSSYWAAATHNGLVEFGEGLPRGEAAARRAIALDSLEGTAWANLGFLRALQERNASAAQPYFDRALLAEPANPEIHLIIGVLRRLTTDFRGAEDAFRIAAQLDPLTDRYTGNVAGAALCDDRPTDALRQYESALRLNPQSSAAQSGVVRSLAALERWQDAIDRWRDFAVSRRDTALVARLRAAQGEEGYWNLVAPNLPTRRPAAGLPSSTRFRQAMAFLSANQVEQAYQVIEVAITDQDRWIYRLHCQQQAERILKTPRFRALLDRIGPMPSLPTTAR